MNLEPPMFYHIAYVLGEYSRYGWPDKIDAVSVDLNWIDRFTGVRRGSVCRLYKSSPVIDGFEIPFPSKAWSREKPNTIQIGDYTYNIVDRWNGYEYTCKEIVELELITHKLPRGLQND